MNTKKYLLIELCAIIISLLICGGITAIKHTALAENTTNEDVQINGIPDGALIRASGDFDVYIVKHKNGKSFKRLILNPAVFKSYKHLHWEDIMDIDRTTVDLFQTSEVARAVNDPKVYVLYPSGDTGEKHWVTTPDVFTGMGFDWDSIYEINQADRDSYITGQPLVTVPE
jgi:hypothetical protein